VLGTIVLVLAVVVGLCFAVVFVAWRIFKAILNGLASFLSPQR
jgi:ABC-type thiamin/hydroxymethylpyrimidine transport system permease subunit